jgi:alkylation response protein AidB-like acyl-CoA dehydrogenase
MQFGLSDDEEALRESVAGFVSAQCPLATTRQLLDGPLGYDPAVWRRAGNELGLAAMIIPESYGGFGASPVAAGVVLRELGRGLTPLPYLSSAVLATTALLALADDEHQGDLLPSLAAAERLATIAVIDEDRPALAIATSAAGRSGVAVSGTKVSVLDAEAADVILVVADSGAGPALYAVDPGSPGMRIERENSLDLTRRQFRVSFNETPGRPLGPAASASGLARLVDVACTALAIEQVGVAEAALHMAVDYAKVREQFARPIGSFQAVKHLCAEMLLQTERASAAAFYALWVAESEPDELAIAARVAKSTCSDAAVAVTSANVQIHGGIGYTWEHDAHLYYRRARGAALMFGSPESHRSALYERLTSAAPQEDPWG